MEVPALPAGLVGENDVCDFHPLIEGFAHVVDCEAAAVTATRASISTPVWRRGHCGSYFHAFWHSRAVTSMCVSGSG